MLCMSRSRDEGFSPIFITAAISVIAVVCVIGWEVGRSISAEHSPSPSYSYTSSAQVSASTGTDATGISTSTDPLSQIGPSIMNSLATSYVQMQQNGTYSSENAEAAGKSLAPYLTAGVSYPAFTATDISTDSDTSYTRMMKYRADLRTSLAPLLNNTEPEFEIFAYYVDTHDASYLRKLQQVADDFRAAASSTALVVAPADAVNYHVAILNAMEEFAATLDAMATHADDPFASVALLSGYNKAESDMLASFNSLTIYYKSKLPL